MESILRRERLIIGSCLTALVIFAWLYLLHSKAVMPDMDMRDMPGMVMPELPWGAVTLLLLFAMWTVMMVAMMVPSAALMVLAFLTMNRSRRANARPLSAGGHLSAGDTLVVWAAYSALATLAQMGFASRGAFILLNGRDESGAERSFARGGRCFPVDSAQTRVPEGLPLTARLPDERVARRHAAGAFVMGLRHGGYCVGCCWVLMSLLFVAGVMNLLWVAAIGLFVMAEKMWTKGELLGHAAGITLVSAGIALIAQHR